MRGVAALAVVIFHLRSMLEPVFRGRTWFGSGYLAVDLFFVLSGFVIAHAYEDRLVARMGFADFAVKRFIRFAPLIWFGLLIGMPLALHRFADTSAVVWATAANAFILPGPVELELTRFPINVPEWSLFYEMSANLAFAALFPFLRGRRIWAVIGLGAVGIVAAVLDHGKISYTTVGAYVSFARVGFGFFAGVALYRSRSWWEPKVPQVAPWIILAVLFIVLACPMPRSLRILFDPIFILIAAPGFVMLAARVEPATGGARAAAVLATISYPIYVLHVPVRDWSTALAQRAALPTAPVAMAFIVALIPATLLLARFYDEPARRWLTAKFRSRPSSHA